MSVFVRFHSRKDRDSVPIDEHGIRVSDLQFEIGKKYGLGYRGVFDLKMYKDGSELGLHDIVNRYESVVCRRLPYVQAPGKPIPDFLRRLKEYRQLPVRISQNTWQTSALRAPVHRTETLNLAKIHDMVTQNLSLTHQEEQAKLGRVGCLSKEEEDTLSRFASSSNDRSDACMTRFQRVMKSLRGHSSGRL